MRKAPRSAIERSSLERARGLDPYTHPELSLHNFPLSEYQHLIDRDDWRAVGEMLIASANKLVRAGAELLICPDNTVHQGIDLVYERSPIQWIHIANGWPRKHAETVFKCVGILGTRFLMEGPGRFCFP